MQIIMSKRHHYFPLLPPSLSLSLFLCILIRWMVERLQRTNRLNAYCICLLNRMQILEYIHFSSLGSTINIDEFLQLRGMSETVSPLCNQIIISTFICKSRLFIVLLLHIKANTTNMCWFSVHVVWCLTALASCWSWHGTKVRVM